MSKIRILIIILIVLLQYSCTDCGRSIELGEFNISDKSLEFFVYSNNDILNFVDQDDREHKLTVLNERSNEETRMIVRTICDEGTFDKQHEYYKIFREQISFQDETNRQVFYLDLKTHYEDDENIDSIAVYDWLSINGTMPYGNGFHGISCEIITDIHLNNISENHFISDARFIGDTILYGTTYEEVFQSSGTNEHLIYFSKIDGIVLIYMDENYYWKLKK